MGSFVLAVAGDVLVMWSTSQSKREAAGGGITIFFSSSGGGRGAGRKTGHHGRVKNIISSVRVRREEK